MAEVNVEKILLVGTQESYDALTPDDGKLYFCSDTMNMYKGSSLYTDGIRVVTTDPTTPAAGKLYYNSTEDVLKTSVNGEWVVVRLATISTVNSDSDDSHIPTAKAVYDFVMASIEEVTGSETVVTDVTAGSEAATVTVSKGNGSTSDVTIKGVALTPSYESETRTITIPTSDGETVTIALGKDIFVQSGEYNAETGNIVLTLNDGETTITIPASALVDVYTGAVSSTAAVVVSDNNEITVNVTLSESEDNSLVIDEDGGLLVDLSEYAKISYVDDAVSTLISDASDLSDRVTAVEDAITLLNGESTTEGSVAYQIAQNNVTLEAEIAAAAAAAQEANDAAAAAQETADENASNITIIVDALGFGTF